MESVDYKVPFYSNTSDDTHCFQACFKMVLKFFLPQKEFSLEELEKITAKVEGLWTWPMAGMVWLKNHGFDVKDIEMFEYGKFAQDPKQYLISSVGEEIAEIQIKHCNLSQEVEYAKEFARTIQTETRIPDIADIILLLKEGYLICCNVNYSALYDKPGYAGHFVIIKGFKDKQLILHDPGLPPVENKIVDSSAFEKAWAYPSESAKGIMAFKFLDSL